jgi:sterol desaturase/sphingolipid hydroxylase (fatty acid hydroxylase superfamily)
LAHLDILMVAGAYLLFGIPEWLSGRLYARRHKGEILVDLVSLAQFVILLKPAVIAGAALSLYYLLPQYAGVLTGLPMWQALLLIVVPADFLHYLYHRSGHSFGYMWSMHRTHHTATEMGVIMGYRENWRWFLLMPDIWYAGVMAYLGLGEAVILSNVIFGVHNMTIHTAMTWDRPLYTKRWLAPVTWVLERLITMPSTHRAHHAELDANGKVPMHNFAQLSMIWDTVFGTAVFPRDHYPVRFGLHEDPLDPWYAQLWYPLLRSPKVDSDYH